MLLGRRKKLLKAIADLSVGTALGTESGTRVQSERAVTSAPATAPSEAERRQLTVMFVDLVGSTALSRRLDPEEMNGLLRSYQNTVAGEIARFEGHVAKLMGDGCSATSGGPRAHEDEAERAVRAGFAVARCGRDPRVPGAAAACPRASASPPASWSSATDGGEGAARERAVAGETPNLAARLQAAAEPGEVLVAEGTRRLLGELFALQRSRRARAQGVRCAGARLRRLGGGMAGAASGRCAARGWRRWSAASASWRCCSTPGPGRRRRGADRPARRRARDRQVDG